MGNSCLKFFYKPLKEIATYKVGREDVARDVARNISDEKMNLREFIKEKIRTNNKITRKEIAVEAGVSVKSVERTIKGIENLCFVGTGKNGYWQLSDRNLVKRYKNDYQ